MKKRMVILFLLLILLCGCNKKDEKTLNVLNWSSYIPDEVIRNFEKETGIKVNYSTYSSNEELLAKVSSAKKGTYDLIFPSDYMIEIMKNRELLERIDKTKLSNYRNINEKYLGLPFDENNDYSLPFLYATVVIAVNKEYIKEEIKSYNDLLNSKYKNDIVLIDDQRMIIGMSLLANGYDMNSINKKELKTAQNWLEKLKPNIKAYDSDSPKNFLITGEAYIGCIWDAEAKLAKQENSNIEIIKPKEGIGISLDNYAISKGAKHISEAYKFINYILDKDVTHKILEGYPYNSVNIATDLEYQNDEMYSSKYIGIDYDSGKQFFVENIGGSIKDYDKIWAEIK